jgi:hypothetical protein
VEEKFSLMNSPLVRFLRIVNSAIRRLALTLIAEQLSLILREARPLKLTRDVLSNSADLLLVVVY